MKKVLVVSLAVFTLVGVATVAVSAQENPLERLESFSSAPSGVVECGYTDVSPSAYYAQAVCWAKERGIIAPSSLFNPNDAAIRIAVATMLWRASGSPFFASSCGLSDASTMTISQQRIACWARSRGIVTSNPFNPLAQLPRSSTSSMCGGGRVLRQL